MLIFVGFISMMLGWAAMVASAAWGGYHYG
jgi:hypothetical protein